MLPVAQAASVRVAESTGKVLSPVAFSSGFAAKPQEIAVESLYFAAEFSDFAAESRGSAAHSVAKPCIAMGMATQIMAGLRIWLLTGG